MPQESAVYHGAMNSDATEEDETMTSAPTRAVGKAIVTRIAGSQPGALRSLAAAAIVGFAAAALTYRGLRSGS